ncbi:hypothetical protein CMV_021569 [Castanea mollissima]|uniref:Uncharacterized protein n=1 Tax=Castanea mollissima TaxID=60419 RepID=A0A8J4VCI1_9ROSI|nr:hypothetical protein CMV_021569 [Castanea mollissima]
MVHFLSTSTIRPTSNNYSTRRIELTPWDLRFLTYGPIQRGLIFLKPTTSQEQQLEENNVIHHLQSSLSRTLDIFYPLAGRLAMIENSEDNTTSFFIDCNNHGAQFVHAAAEGTTMADILEPIYLPQIVDSFFLMNYVLNCEGISKPLLSVQVTELVDCIFIGCTLNHAVCDGTTFWHFFNTWSEISRGTCEKLQPHPIFERSHFDGIINFPVHIPNILEEKTQKLVPPPLKQRYFHFTKEKIAELKAKANNEMGTDRISSLQALLGHFWRSVTRSRCLEADEEVKCTIAMGTRQRMQPPLPKQHFGNAVDAERVTSTAGELIEHGLGWAAWRINNVLASKTPHEVRKFLDEWVKNPRMVNFSGPIINTLLLGSSPRHNVYGNDFGWGKPVALRSGAGTKFDGRLLVFPGKEEGSIDFEACLFAETLEAMGEDAEFMEAVAT